MASNEHSVKYQLIGATDGTRCVFNDPADSDYVGMLTSVTGLDSPEMREYAENRPGDHGGLDSASFLGRRPVTLSGLILTPSSAIDRQNKMEKLSRASNSLQTDAGQLIWDAADGVQKMINVKKQHPLRIGGNFQKTFTVGLVAADPRIYANQLQTLTMAAPGGNGLNYINNPVTEHDQNSWATSAAFLVGGATHTRAADTSPGMESTFAGEVVANGAASQGISSSLGNLPPGTYRVTVKLRRISGTAPLRVFLGLLVGPSTELPIATAAMPSSSEYTTYTGLVTTTGTQPWSLVIRKTDGTATTFRWNAAMVSNWDVPFFYGAQHGAEWVGTAHASQSKIMGGVALVTNAGNVGTPALLTLSASGGGTVVNPILARHMPAPIASPAYLSSSIQFSGYTMASGPLTVDLRTHVVRDGSGAVYNYVDSLNSSWWVLAPGSNEVRWSTDGTPAGTSLNLQWRNAWL